MGYWIVIVLFGIFFICACVSNLRDKEREKERQRQLRKEWENNINTFEISCPYCEFTATCQVKGFARPGTYTCKSCGKSFTEEEREELLEQDREWADTLFEGLSLKEVILEKVRMGDGHIILWGNGVVSWYKNSVGEAVDPIGKLPGLQTRQGKQHMIRRCMEYCRAREPQYKYWLMEGGFAWERIFSDYR